MTWCESILLFIAFFVVLFAVIFVLLLLLDLFDKLVEGIRRKKHPEYFEYWDKAEKLAFERGAEYRKRKDYIDYKLKLYSDGLREGECTEKSYENKMKELAENYMVLCDWFKDAEKEIRELLIKADLYAKEHDCYWGIIYDTKCK